MLTFREIQNMGGVAVVEDASLEKPSMSLTFSTIDQAQFNVEVVYRTPSLDAQIDAAFYAAASSVAAVQSGLLMALMPFLLPDLFPASVRDEETAALIDTAAELMARTMKKYRDEEAAQTNAG